MKKMIALLLALMLTIPLAATGSAAEKAELGQPFRDFTVTTLDGETFTLSEALKDHEAVYINLFATWCPPCRQEFPDLESVYRDYEGRVATIAVSVEPGDTAEVLRQFEQDLDLTLPMAPMGDVDLGYYVFGSPSYSIPDSILIDRFGNMAFLRVGMVPDAERFKRLFDAALGDGYTESRVWTDFPAPAVTVDAPDDAELSAALNAEGGDIAFASAKGNGLFPFTVEERYGRKAAYASNTAIPGTEARFTASFAAEADGALAWDMLYGGGTGLCTLSLALDGETVKTVVGSAPDWTGWAVPVSAGNHEMTVSCVKSEADGAAFDLGLDDFRLLYGDDAETALQSLPSYPVSDISAIVPLDGAREVRITANEYDLGLNVYVAPASPARIAIEADASVDPHGAEVFVSGPDVGSEAALAELYDAGTGRYVLETPLDGDDASGDHLYGVMFVKDQDAENVISALLVKDEKYVDEIIEYYRPQAPDMDWGWHYAGGAVTDAEAGTEATYTVRVVDQDGAGVPDTYINFCTDDVCEFSQSDADGVITYVGVPQVYHLEILKVPEGYSFDSDFELYTEAGSGEYVVEITRD